MMKRYKQLWVNGCSLSFGGEILGYMNYNTENLSKAWPIHLGKLLNIKNIVNNSKCASSNLSIFRSSILELSEIDTKDTLVIIQWTSTNRTEIIYNFEDVGLPIQEEAFFRDDRVGITTGFVPKDVKQNVDFFWNWQADKKYQDELWLLYIWSLQQFLKDRNIDYIMVNGMETLSSPEIISKKLYKDIDQKRFYGFSSKTFYKKDLKSKISHPNERQHINYARELYDYIIQIQQVPL